MVRKIMYKACPELAEDLSFLLPSPQPSSSAEAFGVGGSLSLLNTYSPDSLFSGLSVDCSCE